MGLYANTLLSDLNPALYWRFSELTGSTAVDSSGNGRDGTYGSGVILSGVPGAIGLDPDTAVAFSGTGTSFVRSTYNPFATGVSRSFEGWAYNSAPTTDSTNRSLWGSDGTGNRPYMRVIANSGNVTFRPDSSVGSDSVWTSVWPGFNQWVHWVLIFNDAGDTAELFINGVSQGTRAQTGVFNAAPGNFQAGSLSSPTAAEPFIGGLDEVAVYLTNMSLNAIETHFQIGSQRLTQVRESPPLRFSVLVTTPAGNSYRWAYDEPRAANAPNGLSHSDTMPGGFEQMQGTLPRKPDITYADLERLSTIQFKSIGGYIFGEYRLDSSPRTSGDQFSVSPNAVGWQAHLEDNKFAKMIYRDADLATWGNMSAQRRIDLGASVYTPMDAQVTPDATTGLPRLATEIIAAAWGANDRPNVEALYDANGIVLGSVYWAYADKTASIVLPNANWQWDVFLADSDTMGSADAAGIAEGSSGSGTLTASTGTRKFAAVRLRFDAAGGTSNETYGVYWTYLIVYGNHGLTKRGTEPSAGLFASDVVQHAVQTWAPLLTIAPNSVQQSSFAIPHLSFRDPTTAGEIVRQSSRFDLPDWAVWAKRTFYWAPQGAFARRWHARVGPAQLQETGAQVERLWESIVVQYQDVDGTTKTVGPPGSGASTESSLLKDYDPANPANELGIIRRDMLQMGVSTPAGAIEVGRRFLSESRALDKSGKAQAIGYIKDDRGTTHPYWMPRAGDYISFVDAADSSYRRIVRTDKDHESRTVSFDLDAPPEGLTALLERLGVVLVPLGVGS